MDYQQKDGYKNYLNCRFCNTILQKPVINLGMMPLAGGFLASKNDFKREKVYPLTLSLCSFCSVLQTREVIPQETLFKKYFYFSSRIKTLITHFQDIAQILSQKYTDPAKRLIVEIGCNDGEFLKACAAQKFRIIGVDPASNIVTPLIKKGVPIINDYFSTQIARKIIKKYGKADIIFSSNTLAHIEQIQNVFKGIKNLLKNDGMLIFEVHDLSAILKQYQFDMIYHEHQYYYSVTAMNSIASLFTLELFDVQKISPHGGSLRFFVQHKNGKQKIKSTVKKLLDEEKKLKIEKQETYQSYNAVLQKLRKKLLTLLEKLKNNDKTIIGYGASGRGTILSNYYGLTNIFLDYVVDDAPAKIDTYMPGTHLKIFSSKKLSESNSPDYVILFAWTFLDEIKKKHMSYLENGGKFIIPLPTIRILL